MFKRKKKQIEQLRIGMNKSIAEGDTEPSFIRDMTVKISLDGVDVKKLLHIIYRVNTRAYYGAKRYRGQMDNIESRPYFQYDAINDQRAQASHVALDGKVFRYDDPFWSQYYPPNGWGCRCMVHALTEYEVKNRNLTISSGSNFDAPDTGARWYFNPGDHFVRGFPLLDLNGEELKRDADLLTGEWEAAYDLRHAHLPVN